MRSMLIGCVLTLATTLGLAASATEVVQDEEGRVVQEIELDGSTVDYRYDEEGRVIEETHPDGTVVRYWYDEQGVQHVATE